MRFTATATATALATALALALAPVTALALAGPAASQQSASPTPTACPAVGSLVTVQQPPIIPSGGTASIRVVASGPSATYTVSLTRQEPAPVAVVRSATVDTGTAAVFAVRLGETHRFSVTASSSEPCFSGYPASAEFFVQVRAVVSIAATRRSTRDYSFTGRVQPAGGIVSIYRVESTGRRVLTSQTSVRPDGSYRVDRRFVGSGRFGFVAVVGGTDRHVGGTSPVRPTVIH